MHFINHTHVHIHNQLVFLNVSLRTKLTKINANIGNGAREDATLAATNPRETVMSAAKPSAVNGDDITIGNCNAINTPHIIMIVNSVNSISAVD